MIKNPHRGQFIRKVVLVVWFRAYQFSRLARGQRMWCLIKARQWKRSRWPESLGSRCGPGLGQFWISGQPRQNQRNRGDGLEKHSGSATSGGATLCSATRRPEQARLCHVVSKGWYHRKIPPKPQHPEAQPLRIRYFRVSLIVMSGQEATNRNRPGTWEMTPRTDSTLLSLYIPYIYISLYIPCIYKRCAFSRKSLPRAGFRPKTGIVRQSALAFPWLPGTRLMSNLQVIESEEISWQKH